MAKKNEKTAEKTETKIEFAVLKNEGDSIEGVYQSFGKNKYGTFITLKTASGIKNMSVQNAVLNSLIKTNIDLFIDNENLIKVKFIRGKKAVGKKYILFDAFVEGEQLKGTQSEMSARDIKEIF